MEFVSAPISNRPLSSYSDISPTFESSVDCGLGHSFYHVPLSMRQFLSSVQPELIWKYSVPGTEEKLKTAIQSYFQCSDLRSESIFFGYAPENCGIRHFGEK